jgi:hypothetical protein
VLDLIACPQCGAPAEVVQRFWLPSTDGPVEHLKTTCVSKHWLTPPAETVHQQWPAVRAPAGCAAKLARPGAAGGPRHRSQHPR